MTLDALHRIVQRASNARWTHALVDDLVSVLSDPQPLGPPSSFNLDTRRAIGALLREDHRQGARVLPLLLCAGRLDLSYMGLERLPEAACDLPGLAWLGLEHNNLTSLPEALGRSQHLVLLALTDTPVQHLPAAARHLASLETLLMDRPGYSQHPPLTQTPRHLFDLPALKSLSLAGHQLQTLPDDVGRLTQLQHLTLDNNRLTRLPDAIGACAALSGLRAEHNQLTALPDSIGQLARLRALHLDHNQLTALPDSIAACASLQSLYARDNRLTHLPDAIGACTSLQALHLDKNSIAALPDSIGQLIHLRFLHLRQNKLSTLPWAMHQLTALEALHVASNPALKAPPDALLYLSLREASGLPGGRKRTLAQRITLFKHLSQTRLPLDARRRVAALFETGDADTLTWLEALHVKSLRDDALQHLTQAPPPPLDARSVVAAAGKVALKKTDLQRRLKEKNLKYSAKIDSSVTHIVLGPAPEDPAAIAASQAALVRDTWLHDALEQGRDHFLAQPPSAPIAQAQRENLRAMLSASDEPTVHTAIELLKDGGVPLDALPELLGLALLAPWPTLRRAAHALVTLHGDDTWRAALLNKPRLLQTNPPALDRTANSFYLWQQKFPSIPMDRVALLALRHRNHGLRYLFRHLPPEHPSRVAALHLIRRDGAIAFGPLYSDQVIHCDLASHHPAYQRQALPFPPELLRHPDLRSLDLSGALLGEVPDELGLFTDLEHLDLSLCLLKRLPNSLADLKRLRSLNLAGNQLLQAPDLLAQLPALTHLSIARNHHGGHASPITLPDHLRAALPNLKILREGAWYETTLPEI